MSSVTTMDGLTAMLTFGTLLRFLGLWILYHVGHALYNISPLHPLNHIPGPRLAAMTLLVEFWYDFVLGGRYTQVIKKMHDTYGEQYPNLHALAVSGRSLVGRCTVIAY